jgi:uncharacterized UBP type Zn finger protein
VDTPSDECSPEVQQLPPEGQRLALQIAEMGFAQARVARACQIVGNDHKKASKFYFIKKLYLRK